MRLYLNINTLNIKIIMDTNEIKVINDTISSIVCYIMGEFNTAQLESKMKEFELPKDVVEHIRTVVVYNENLLQCGKKNIGNSNNK